MFNLKCDVCGKGHLPAFICNCGRRICEACMVDGRNAAKLPNIYCGLVFQCDRCGTWMMHPPDTDVQDFGL